MEGMAKEHRVHASWALEVPRELYPGRVRGVEVRGPGYPGEGHTHRAWGPDGQGADWEELGLSGALRKVVWKVVWFLERHRGVRLWGGDRAVLHLGEGGWLLEVDRYLPERGEWVREAWRWGEAEPSPGEDEPAPRPLLDRLQYLLARYRTWYRNEAPRSFRERHSERPTLEALLEWGRERGEWSLAEEPMVPELLKALLEDR
ncbi:hypothetical protein HRbin39_01253 [bacterium HR39]|nr:hypothetical protein HRbin39_01253 [bacterium HR39]